MDTIITPGASTVAKFEAVLFLEISHVSECLLNIAHVNAFNMSWLYYPSASVSCRAFL